MASISPSSRWITVRCSASPREQGRSAALSPWAAAVRAASRRARCAIIFSGFRCVTGRGEIVKSGGRVMKNVTGYDLSKLVAGSHGTLAALTEVTFKALPKPETEQTLLLTGLGEEAGARGAARGFRLAI